MEETSWFEDWAADLLTALGAHAEFPSRNATASLGADGPQRLFPVAERTEYLVRLRPGNVMECGLATQRRTVNEEIEEFALEQGGELSEVLADELHDLGLPETYPVHHFFDRPDFLFVVRLTDADHQPVERIALLLAAWERLLRPLLPEPGV